ncbi:Histone-lysine N-methyltransferase SETMAR [Eumeta japonica]|uniref:Histone-lysine N-methyltransferase SETMAR n=1 Tax=Eumeta variegata TaxID=151549 RepID=A0A4C2A275_EUMVA|nr:Histone-lysine N-methyltransferase SETMAR [Eumeta japonica]
MRHESQEKNCDVYGPKAVTIKVAQNWFKRFQSGNFDVNEEPRSGQPVTEKVDAILENVEQDHHISSYDITEELEIVHKTVLTHLKKARCIKKLIIWVPHDFTERYLINRVLMCDSLLKRNKTEMFLKITGDEKWITTTRGCKKIIAKRQGNFTCYGETRMKAQ